MNEVMVDVPHSLMDLHDSCTTVIDTLIFTTCRLVESKVSGETSHSI